MLYLLLSPLMTLGKKGVLVEVGLGLCEEGFAFGEEVLVVEGLLLVLYLFLE